jgi:prepilin-type N-terminal cleavage/methylation domain-containing protein
MKKAFTLIELLIVVAIIAILAAIAVPNFLEAQVRAKVVSVRGDFRNIYQAHETYRIDWNKYPPDKVSGKVIGTNWYYDYLNFVALTTPIAYLSSVPVNPFFDKKQSNTGLPVNGVPSRGNYSYWAQSDGAVYNPKIGVYYHCTSCGPDGISSMGGTQLNAVYVKERQKPFIDALYDPSNGSVSFGDLHVSNLGISY